MTRDELISFEKEIAEAFEKRLIKGPIHLSGGNEDILIDLFKEIPKYDWVFSSYRNHYHALLHGVPREWIKNEILAGRSMNIYSPEHRFFSSAIVAGQLPIAVGTAMALKRTGSPRAVWCFIGDMGASIGTFQDSLKYSEGHNLPVHFIVEDNGFSCNSPTQEIWGQEMRGSPKVSRYSYNRQFPHMGIGRWIEF